MSSDRLDSIITDLEINTFAEALDALPAYHSVSEAVCQEMADEVQALAFSAARRAIVDLRAMRSRQYHRVLLSDGHLEALINFDTLNRQGEPQRLHVTTNMSTWAGDAVNIDVQDFAVGLRALSVAHRQGSQRIVGAPTDLLEGTLPVLWKTDKGVIERFTGHGYRLDAAKPLSVMNFTELSRQLSRARALGAVMAQLSLQDTLAEEYPS